MNFFEHQDAARRRTRIMLVLYALAVAGVVLGVDLLLAAVYSWTKLERVFDAGGAPGAVATLTMVPTAVYVWGTVATLAIILGASIVQTVKLGGGGPAVAAMLGARQVAANTRDPLERRLLNIVEEMAIASGVRVPPVFIMDGEGGVNAFAAGTTVSNSVVAVTRGTLETLNRDELQGVVAHEFSHILNGDVALNIRMLGILAGIVFISSVGSFIMRNLRGGKKDTAGIFVIGLALFIIGYIGLFFARLIKASVSRQREFLADASSVQFTRNPEGIAGALDQIRASGRGTLVENRYAEEMAHMFFGQGISVWLGGLFDTHPPLEERIRRVHPRFQPTGYRTRRVAAETADADAGTASALPAGAAGFGTGAGAAAPQAGVRAADLGVAWGRSAGASMALVGTVGAGKVDHAQRLLAALPAGLRERLHESEGACAAVVALLLAPRDSVMEQQLAAARASGAAGAARLADAAAAVARELRGLGPAFHLGVVDIALPALKAAPAELQAEFIKALEAVINADRRVSLNEFALLTLVRSQLEPGTRSAQPRFRALGDVRPEAVLLLALCARAGSRQGAGNDAVAEHAFRAGAKELGFDDAALPARDALALQAVGRALETLRGLAPLPKAVLVKALFATVTADGTIRIVEAALMRMVGAVLDCPLPPLLEDLDPATLAE